MLQQGRDGTMPHPFADSNAISSTDEIQFSSTNENGDYFPRVSTSQDFWVSPPRPIYHRPASYGMPSPVCSHCGGIAPRSGSTTVYGTPLKARSAISSTVSLLQVTPIPMTGFRLTQLIFSFLYRTSMHPHLRKRSRSPLNPSVSSRESMAKTILTTCPVGNAVLTD
jgi:hypothetical protein